MCALSAEEHMNAHMEEDERSHTRMCTSRIYVCRSSEKCNMHKFMYKICMDTYALSFAVAENKKLVEKSGEGRHEKEEQRISVHIFILFISFFLY